MKGITCYSAEELRNLLQAEDGRVPKSYEIHVEHCPHCRRELDRLAGGPAWLQAVQEHLSSVSDGAADEKFATRAMPGIEGRGAQKNLPLDQWLAKPSHPEMLGRIGRYDVERVLGQGGFGVVFKGYDSELNRPVAIKVLAPHLASSGVARRRFAREAQAAAAISHPNVVPIHAVDAHGDMPYLVMTFVPGHSLQALVHRYGPLDTRSVVRIGQQVAAGLAAAHRQGLVHRDIKPANILLENDLSRAMITDFGLARAADDVAATQTGWLAGTPLYMSPEQASGQDLDARSDLFSLGSVLYFLATGRPPFRSDSPLAVLRLIKERRPLTPERINPDVPKELSRTIMRLLEKDPRDRFASAAELEAHLEAYLAHLQRPQTCPRPRLGWTRRESRRWIASALAVLSVCGALGVGAAAWRTWNLQTSSAGQLGESAVLQRETPAEPSSAGPLRLTLQEIRELLQWEDDFRRDLSALEQAVQQVEAPAAASGFDQPPIAPSRLSLEVWSIDRQIDQVEAKLRGN